ncbi:hypothetical protein HN51_042288 [Arachis hypogaea]|nr:transcription factor bHLH85-like [Arachis hypogaea]QHN88197.1 Transcription factor [Arachis hypogaea]
MEFLGAFPNNIELDCFKMFSTEKEHDFTYTTTTTSQLFLDQSSSLLGEDDELNFGLVQSTLSSNLISDENEHYLFHSLDANPNTKMLHYKSQEESSYNSGGFSGGDTTFFNANMDLTTNYYYSSNYHDLVLANDVSMEDNVKFNENNVGSDDDHRLLENYDHYQCHQMEHVDVVPNNKQLQLKKKIVEVPEFDVSAENNTSNGSKNQKKKHFVAKDEQDCMKNERSRKRKVVRNGNEGEERNNNVGLDGQSSSSNINICEDDNASEENNGGVTSVSHSNGKTRTIRGTAADPQSLYARKRRERINARLRILQSLVPNGTKVDISTMLEEAVNYVKFLQLQIKLLSSDDLWMYAPLAYNGLDIGLKLNNLKNFSSSP